ncbi:MAG TPA: PhoH family protein [Candidatus Sulfotelmatobacter sp.]|nr:PhoH family protein [Candidatus Sulfotelmatobacter sp.]
MPPEARRGDTAKGEGRAIVLDFDDNRLLGSLFGEHDRNLARIEQALDVSLNPRGNRLAISGPPAARDAARAVLDELYRRLKLGEELNAGDIDGVLRVTGGARGKTREQARKPPPGRAVNDDDPVINTRKRVIAPRTPMQRTYLRELLRSDLVFGLGPAGTGKTYLAVAVAVSMLLSGQVDRIVLSRPAVEAGERLGFLPGDMREKVDPYLRPLYDALYDMLPGEQVAKRLESGEIEIAPLAFMRGRTLANAYVILDEAQNTTPVQMKMLLTRLGENSRMCVTGDLSQVDLPAGTPSGLRDALSVLEGIDEIAVVHFSDVDVVRHGLVARVVRAYAERDRAAGPDGGGQRT